MSYIRWSTKLPNGRISNIYAWSDVRGGVVISRAWPNGKNSDPIDIKLSHAEMRHMCESYLQKQNYWELMEKTIGKRNFNKFIVNGYWYKPFVGGLNMS